MRRRALVVFCENSGVWWLKGLKKGFRHCFIILETEDHLILVEATLRHFHIKILAEQDLKACADWYAHQQMTVLPVHVNRRRDQNFPMGPMSCVEVIKRLLGVHAACVLTPWQLHQFILEQKMKINEFILDNCQKV